MSHCRAEKPNIFLLYDININPLMKPLHIWSQTEQKQGFSFRHYLGGHIAKELHERSIFFRAIVRNPEKFEQNDIKANELLKAELTDPDSIRECCKGIDIVISTVGITKQKDGLTYIDVDYQANMNLLKEAKKNGVINPAIK